MQNYFTTITGADFYDNICSDAVDGITEWSINKNARSGDVVLFYVCRPLSSIVAVANVIETPYLNEDISSCWYGKHFAEMENLRMLTEPISRFRLLEKFPNWNYWKQPRNSIQIGNEFLSQISELFKTY